MTCAPANEPQRIEVTDLIYSPADFERRFLTGWWTRGLLPLDNFVITNWAGLIKPAKVTFDENEITFEFPGRYWMDESECRRSMPKVLIKIQYLCKGGRLYLHSDVWYGKNYSQQTYAGHNGAQKLSRVPLEKFDEACSLERSADIPIEKADILELKHLADWIVTMISAEGVQQINQPNLDWVELFADYTESDLEWAPCDGCLFPTQNYSIPVTRSNDTMLELEARLVVQNIKALGQILILSSVPETFNVPLCAHNTYLEVTLPEMSAVTHMREFFDCGFQYFGDQYYTIPVKPADIVRCFQFPDPTPPWPARDNPKWIELCPSTTSVRCDFGAAVITSNTGYDGGAKPFSSYGARNFGLCSGSHRVDGKVARPQGGIHTVVASSVVTKSWYEIVCTTTYGYYGQVGQQTNCQQMVSQQETILYEARQTLTEAYKTYSKLMEANRGWNCNSTFNPPDGGSGPPQPNLPPKDDPQGPNKEDECFFEGEITYALNIQTAIGSLVYDFSIPVRAKVPKGTVNLGPISGSISGQTITVSTVLGGSFSKDLGSLFAAFSAVGNAIASVIPVSFGLRNPRILCP